MTVSAGTVGANSASGVTGSCGLEIGGTLSVSGYATVKAYGTQAGIMATNITLSGGTVTAAPYDEGSAGSYGIKATGAVAVSDGTLTATGSLVGLELGAGSSLTVSGTGKVTITGSPSSTSGLAPTGIQAGSYSGSADQADITVTGGKLTVNAASSTESSSQGISFIHGNLAVTGGEVLVTADIPLEYASVTSGGGLTVSDSGVLTLDGTCIALRWYQFGVDSTTTPNSPNVSVNSDPTGAKFLWKVVENGSAEYHYAASYTDGTESELAVDFSNSAYYITNALMDITFGTEVYPGHTGHDLQWARNEDETKHARYCATCETRITDWVEHTWGEGRVTTTPTCGTEGVMTYTCVCGKTKTESIAATGEHSYAYTANDATITETCTRSGCGHHETATISIPASANLTYTGDPLTPATVAYSTDWAGGDLTIDYTNNTNAGTATATITCGDATASKTFAIAPADYTVTPSATSGTITVGSTAGPDLTVNATGVNSASVSGNLTKWYSDESCNTLISSFGEYTVGKHMIYWKYVSTDSNYTATAKTGSYALTVAEGAEQELDWNTTGSLMTTYGTGISGKTATNSSEGGGAITYSSSNAAVATVDSASGALTIVGAGETTITATAAAVTGTYCETAITYPLTVSKKDVTVTVTPATRKFGESNPVFAAAVTAGGLAAEDSIADLGLGLTTTATATSNVGSYDVTGDGSYNANYNVTVIGANALTVTKADARTLDDIAVSQKYTVTAQQSKSVAGLMPSDAGTLTYTKGTASGTAAVTEWSVDANGNLTFTVSGVAGNSTTLPVTIGSTNYADSTVNVVITLTDKDVPTVSANALTVTYTGSAVPASAIIGTATFGGNAVSGVWSWKNATAVTDVADSGTKTVVFTPNDTNTYATAETNLTLTINKATPTGEPKYTAITESGKTLSDAGLTAEGGTLSIPGSVKWVDANGNDLANTTVVTANTGYRWLFTPEDTANYNTLSGSVTLYRVSSGGGGGSSTSTTTPVEPTTSTSNGTTTAVVTVKPSTSGTSSTASVSTSTVQAAVDAAAKSDASSAAVEIQVSTPANATEVKVSLPTAALETVADGKTESLTIQSGVGSVTLSSEALASVAKQAESAVEITISEVDTAKTLNERQQAAAGDAPVYDLSIKSGSRYISEFDGGLITVSLPYTLKAGEDPSGVVVWYLDENGNIEKVRTMYDVKTQTVIFTTNHFSLYVVGYDPTALWTNPFTDVSESDYYCDAVRWAAAKGVTSGTSATTFAPNTTCTRAQTVTFLWRAAGSPEPTATANPFTDVSEDAYYYKAVLWAVGEGITAGTSATTFAPDATVSRAQVAAFLWRAAGKSTVDYAMAFTDVPADSYYTEAVRWAVSEGITSGTSDTTFAPNQDCTRAQIVTFLYRDMNQ